LTSTSPHASPFRPTTTGKLAPTGFQSELTSFRSKIRAVPETVLQSFVVTTTVWRDLLNGTFTTGGTDIFTCAPAAIVSNIDSRNWTVRKAKAKFAHFKLAKRATANSPMHSTIPEKTVNSTLAKVTVDKRFQKGARSPKIRVITATKPADIYNASRDE